MDLVCHKKDLARSLYDQNDLIAGSNTTTDDSFKTSAFWFAALKMFIDKQHEQKNDYTVIPTRRQESILLSAFKLLLDRSLISFNASRNNQEEPLAWAGRLAQGLGYTIVFEHTPDPIAWAMTVEGKTSIYVHNRLKPLTAFARICHEIGHFCLMHKFVSEFGLDSERLDARSLNDFSLQEKEADFFADSVMGLLRAYSVCGIKGLHELPQMRDAIRLTERIRKAKGILFGFLHSSAQGNMTFVKSDSALQSA